MYLHQFVDHANIGVKSLKKDPKKSLNKLKYLMWWYGDNPIQQLVHNMEYCRGVA